MVERTEGCQFREEYRRHASCLMRAGELSIPADERVLQNYDMVFCSHHIAMQGCPSTFRGTTSCFQNCYIADIFRYPVVEGPRLFGFRTLSFRQMLLSVLIASVGFGGLP